ncbi:MAG: Ig-like domain-containing protein, partial [Candidatus Komeilibacteria bacterium]
MLESSKIFLSKRRIAILSIYFLVAILFLFAAPVFAADSFNLDQTGTELNLTPVAEDFSIRQTVIDIVKYLISFIGTVAIVMILYGAVRWMTAGGSADKVAKAKKTIINAAIGLMICILSYAIVYFVAFQLGDEVFGDGSSNNGNTPYYSGGLGGGAIASHYPPRGAVGIARNINIVVTFREDMDIDSVNNDTVEVKNNTDNTIDQVAISSVGDNKTFIFDPVDLLGSDATANTYLVTLSNDIYKADGDRAFGDLGGIYNWQFTVSTEVDVTPPTIVGVYPVEAAHNPA